MDLVVGTCSEIRIQWLGGRGSYRACLVELAMVELFVYMLVPIHECRACVGCMNHGGERSEWWLDGILCTCSSCNDEQSHLNPPFVKHRLSERCFLASCASFLPTGQDPSCRLWCNSYMLVSALPRTLKIRYFTNEWYSLDNFYWWCECKQSHHSLNLGINNSTTKKCEI